MSFLIDIREELDDQIQKQLRKFRQECAGTGYNGWYRIQAAIAKARDLTIYHDKIENYIMPNLFDENGDAIAWYHWRDPQQVQVNMIKRNLQTSSKPSRKRGRVTPTRLRMLMKEILDYRINEYLNPKQDMAKLKILCIVGGSGCGKTLASLHLKYHKDANVICSFTTRPPRPTEVEGRDHHFIDIVPDRTELIAYAHFGGYYYYATKWQVFGPCTVYVIDEKGLENLRNDFGDVYDIYTVLIKRDKALRRKSGIDETRLRRDERRDLKDEDYDYVIINNGKKAALFESIECIYEEIKTSNMAAPVEKSNVVVAIVYDFETGGLDCTKSAATQISLHAVRLDTFEVTEKYSAYIYPYSKKADLGKPKKKVLKNKYDTEEEELMEYSSTALDISGVTMDLLYQMGKPIEDVCNEICDFIERNTLPVVAGNKPFMVGQNPLFDNGFMQQIMLYTGIWSRFIKLVRGHKDFWGNFQPTQLDTILLSQLTFDNDKSITTWKLEAMAERLGIDLDDAHDADADVTATREILRVLTARMREQSAGGGTAIGSLAAEKREKLRDHFKI